MSRRPRKERGAPARGLTPVYEGPEVLSALLERAGSPFGVDEVAARFAAAIGAGETRASVIPSLFEEEPRFATPDDARRLYANLFGLWGRVADGRGPHDDAPAVVREASPSPSPSLEPSLLPERGAVGGNSPTADVVDGVWRRLAAATEHDVRRLRDRFTNTQPELGAWLEELSLPEGIVVVVHELAFETWAIFDQCFGERLGVAPWGELRALEREPPALEAEHPALAAYVSEQLDNLGDEDPNFGAAERAHVERTMATLAAALSGAVAEPS